MDSSIWTERRLSNLSKRTHDHRSPFQRDRARILHSAAFRRLQSKTQVMGNGQSDFYRTRLTHSLEAAQIGSGITAQLHAKSPELCHQLLPKHDALIEALCLTHDIGHPPFGHGGEVALNFMMREHGGFEGNGQTFRILTRLEPYSEHYGMNLTRRVLLGILKYPQTLNALANQEHATIPQNLRQLKANDWHPPKGIYQDDAEILDWVLSPLSDADKNEFQQYTRHKHKHHKTRCKSLDCSIMELADDIAYGIHDLEDAIVTNFVFRDDFEQQVVKPLLELDDPWLTESCPSLADKLFSNQHHLQKDAIGALVNYLITAIELVDLNESEKSDFYEPILRYNAKLTQATDQALEIFKVFVRDYVIKQPSIQRLEYRGQQIVMELFEALSSDPQRLLPSNTLARWRYANEKGLNPQRVIADYVAGMTDEYATKLYGTLFLPGALSLTS